MLVTDEASMVDVLLIRWLLKALPDSAGLLIVGDVDQLLSIGPGQVLADIIASARGHGSRFCSPSLGGTEVGPENGTGDLVGAGAALSW
jgi:hypothetical protein